MGTAREPSISPSTKGGMATQSSTTDEAGESSTDSYIEESSSELDWTFSQAIETIRNMGPESVEKRLTLTFQNMTVLGDPVGDSLVDTVWSSANPLEMIRSLRHNKEEPRVSSSFSRENDMLLISRLSSMISLAKSSRAKW
jgi:hypothetical protein